MLRFVLETSKPSEGLPLELWVQKQLERCQPYSTSAQKHGEKETHYVSERCKKQAFLLCDLHTND